MNNTKRTAIKYISIYGVLVLVIAFASPMLGGSPSKPGPGFILWGAAPLLVAVLLRLLTHNWADAGLKPAFRKNLLWYGISLLCFPVLTVLTIILGELTSVSVFSGFAILPFLRMVLSAMPVFFVFAIFEEYGWRGYLVPKLDAAGAGSVLTAAVTAVIWTTWHLPYISELVWAYGGEALAAFIPRYYLALFAFALLYNEIRRRSGSFWPAVLMHCMANAFAHPLVAEYMRIAPGKAYLVSTSGLYMIGLTGLLGMALISRRRKGTAVPV